MPVINGTGISYGDPLYNQYSDQTAATTVQSDANCIIKVKFTSATTINQSAAGSGSNTLSTGTEINMGVPTKSTNWYRVSAQTVVDDNDSSISGFGMACYRYTPSSGWERVLDTGEHWSYDNNLSDWYRTNRVIWWVPVHQTYPTQEHQFRLHIRTHDSGNVRWNCDIGNWGSSGNWKNNIFEVWEVDGDRISSTGNLTRY